MKFKISELFTLFASTFFVFIQPIIGLFILALIFIFIDTFYAIYVSVKMNKGWSKFSSKRFSDILVKGIIYGLSIMVSHLIDVHILKESLFFGIPPIAAKSTTFVILFIETKSIDEKRVLMGKKSLFEVARDYVNKGKRAKKDIDDLL
jgi:hypothetical protein